MDYAQYAITATVSRFVVMCSCGYRLGVATADGGPMTEGYAQAIAADIRRHKDMAPSVAHTVSFDLGVARVPVDAQG